MSLRPTCCRLMSRWAGQGPLVRTCKGAVGWAGLCTQWLWEEELGSGLCEQMVGKSVVWMEQVDFCFILPPPPPCVLKPASWKRLHRKGSPAEYLLALRVLRGFVWFGYSVATNTCHVPGMGYNLECHSQKVCMFPWCTTSLLPPYPQTELGQQSTCPLWVSTSY